MCIYVCNIVLVIESCINVMRPSETYKTYSTCNIVWEKDNEIDANT